jgi:NAD-dependent SIR2 family protein deacetylase
LRLEVVKMEGTGIHDERARLISRRILEELASAADRLFEDEALGAKYLIRNVDGNGYRMGFKEGIGFEITFNEVYRPESKFVCELHGQTDHYHCETCGCPVFDHEEEPHVCPPGFLQDRISPRSPEGWGD